MKSSFLKTFLMWLLFLFVIFSYASIFLGTYDVATSRERISGLVGIFIFMVPIALLITFFHKWAIEARQKFPESEAVVSEVVAPLADGVNIIKNNTSHVNKWIGVSILIGLSVLLFLIWLIPREDTRGYVFVIGMGIQMLIYFFLFFVVPATIFYFIIRAIIRRSFK